MVEKCSFSPPHDNVPHYRREKNQQMMDDEQSSPESKCCVGISIKIQWF